MRKSFMCSLIYHGVLGGALYVTDDVITYRTGKLTVPDEIRNLELPVAEIQGLEWESMGIAKIILKDGMIWKFLIFNRKGFQQAYDVVKQNK